MRRRELARFSPCQESLLSYFRGDVSHFALNRYSDITLSFQRVERALL